MRKTKYFRRGCRYGYYTVYMVVDRTSKMITVEQLEKKLIGYRRTKQIYKRPLSMRVDSHGNEYEVFNVSYDTVAAFEEV